MRSTTFAESERLVSFAEALSETLPERVPALDSAIMFSVTGQTEEEFCTLLFRVINGVVVGSPQPDIFTLIAACGCDINHEDQDMTRDNALKFFYDLFTSAWDAFDTHRKGTETPELMWKSFQIVHPDHENPLN